VSSFRGGPAGWQDHLSVDEENYMLSRAALDQLAPNFSLPDFEGRLVSLSDFLGKKNVLLVFNRTFA
jgi:hypothetical protein